jgi:hypothetical protein
LLAGDVLTAPAARRRRKDRRGWVAGEQVLKEEERKKGLRARADFTLFETRRGIDVPGRLAVRYRDLWSVSGKPSR